MSQRKSPAQGVEAPSEDVVAAAVRRHQQVLLARQVPMMMFLNIGIAMFLAGFLSAFISFWLVLAWLALMLSASGYLLSNAVRLRRRPLPSFVTGRTLARARYWAVATGLLWACALIFFPVEEPRRYLLFLAVVMIGLASGAVSMLLPIPRIVVSFAVAILTPLVLRLTIEGDPLFLTLALLTLFFFFTFMSSSQRAYRQLKAVVASSLELERAKTDLVDAIESIRDAFAIWRPDGRLELANERFRSWFGEPDTLNSVPGTEGLHRMPGNVWLQGYVRPMSGGGHVSVHTDVTALKNRERELIAAKLQAEEANNAKSHFLANMSHELRTPLNAIMGFAEMMRKGVFGPLGTEKYRQYADDIHGSAAQLLAVINDILNLSKIQAARYELNFEPVDIARLVESVLSSCDHLKEGFEASRIEVQIEPDFGPLCVDSGILRQVLLNLVRNAMKFTPASGRVTICAKIDDRSRPCISVADTGIGIPAEMLATVRQPFQQAEPAFERKFRGAGLGLSISDGLVRLLGGELKLESEVGKGTRVEIVLPAALRERAYPQGRSVLRR